MMGFYLLIMQQLLSDGSALPKQGDLREECLLGTLCQRIAADLLSFPFP